MRRCILDEGKRLDGRKTTEIRPIWCEVGYLPGPHGSAIFTRGETQSLTSVTLGTKLDEKIIDDIALCNVSGKKTIANLNFGLFQGTYIGITKQPNANNIYVLSALEEKNHAKIHLRFMVYGALGEFIEATFTKGELILIEYKIEKSKRLRPDGQADYFTNCVLERIG